REVDGLLWRRVGADHGVAVRLDQPGDHGRPAAIADDVGARRTGAGPRSDRGDPAVADEDHIGVGAWIGQPAGDERTDVDEAERGHQYSPRQRSTMAFALVQS